MSKAWPLVSMESIFAIARGGSPRPIDSFLTDDPDGVNWVMISDATASGKYINSTKKRIRQDGVKRSRLVKPGDFLLTNSMSYGRPYIMNTSGCIHDGWLALSPRNGDVLPEFFYHLLGSDLVYSEFSRRAAGATVKNLNIEMVKDVRVPLPPVAEQRQIAAILDKAEALRAKRQAILTGLDRVLRNTFLDMFGDPASNSKNLPTIPLCDVAEFVGGGTPSRAVPKYFTGAICWATCKDMSGELLSDTQEHVTEEAVENSATRIVPPGSVLVVVKSKVLLNRLPVLVNTVPTCFGQDLKAIRVSPPWSAKYIARHMRIGQRTLLERARGINTEGLTLEHLRTYRVLAPPKDDLKEFEQLEQSIEKQKERARISQEHLDALFSSLQHRAFRGEL